MGGRFVLLLFAPAEPEARAQAYAALEAHRPILDDDRISAFVVLRDRAEYAAQRDGQGLRWFLDASGEITRLYGAEQPLWVILDPMLRVYGHSGMEHTARVFRALAALPPAARHTGDESFAPVLTVPRILEPDLCKRLIAHYQETGGEASGTMVQIDGKTVGVLNDFKKRRDRMIADESLRTEIRSRLRLRLCPEILKAFQYKVTRVERYIVACYDADSGGYFRPHRDNTTSGTAHRRFAVSINLNDDFEGGDLRFPEFGRRTYRPPLGGAVVFSCSLLHEATAVTRGTRYATLPFLFDDAADEIRRANLHTLEENPPMALAATG